MAQSEPQTVGNQFELNSLSVNTNQNAYNYNFIDIRSVEPSLGLPNVNNKNNDYTIYYFPVFSTVNNYSDSRKTTYQNLYYYNNNLGIGTIPNQPLTISGNISSNQTVFAGNVTLTNTVIQSFSTPVTATGDFLVLNINGQNKAIRLWDF
jgi:hypothetical protein